MRSILLLLLIGVGTATSDASEPAPSRPYWTGRLEQDTTWRDTVYVGGDVTIAAAATLTLAPNTQVLFLPYRDATRGGLDSTRAELIVEGRLAAGGIVFRSADAGSLGADWYGLVVEQGGRADVSYAAIRDGLRCLYAKRGGRVIMDRIAFANCGKPTAPADAAKLGTPAGTERKEELVLSHPRETKITPLMNQPFERQEITIHISGEHKAVISALLAAVEAETPVTGIAELDSLATTYGLMGIYRKGRMSPFYGYRFRLAFSPGADVVAIARAYWNLSCIESVVGEDEPVDAYLRAITRIPTKVGLGTLTSVGLAAVFVKMGGEGVDGIGTEILVYPALFFGYPLGVYLADPVESSFWMTYAGHVAGSLGAILLLEGKDPYYQSSELRKWTALGAFMGASVMASELSRLGKSRRPSSRVSFGLVPDLQRGLSARATLRF